MFLSSSTMISPAISISSRSALGIRGILAEDLLLSTSSRAPKKFSRCATLRGNFIYRTLKSCLRTSTISSDLLLYSVLWFPSRPAFHDVSTKARLENMFSATHFLISRIAVRRVYRRPLTRPDVHEVSLPSALWARLRAIAPARETRQQSKRRRDIQTFFMAP